MGRWDDAVVIAEDLLQQSGPSPVDRLNPLVSLGRLRARRGEEGAWDCLAEASALAAGLREPEWIALVATASAEACWLEGRTDDALAELAAVAEVTPACGAHLASAITAWRHRIAGSRASGADLVEPYASEVEGDARRAARRWDDLGFPYESALAMLGSTDEAMLRDGLAPAWRTLGADGDRPAGPSSGPAPAGA